MILALAVLLVMVALGYALNARSPGLFAGVAARAAFRDGRAGPDPDPRTEATTMQAPNAPRAAQLPLVEAFDSGRDVIVVELGPDANPDPEIALRREGDCEVLSLDGIDVARIRAGEGISTGNVRLVLGGE